MTAKLTSSWLTRSDIEQAKADRDSLQPIIQSVEVEIVVATRLLTSRGLDPNRVGTFTDSEIETAFQVPDEIQVIQDALEIVRAAEQSLLDAYDGMAAFGLDAFSNDLSVALPFVDQDEYSSLRSDRDRLFNTDIVPSQASSRLTNLGLNFNVTPAADIEKGTLASVFVDTDLLGVLKDDRQSLATSGETDFATSTNPSVIAAYERLSSLGLSITRGQVSFASLQSNELSILHDATYGSFTLGFSKMGQEEAIVVAHDADPTDFESQLESLDQFIDVTVSVNSDQFGRTGWLITFHDPVLFDVANVRVVDNASLSGDASDEGVAAGVLTTDLSTPNLDSAIALIAAGLTARGLTSTSTAAEIDAIVGLQPTYVEALALTADDGPLDQYNDHRIVSLFYENNQFFVGFNFSVEGNSGPLDLSELDAFLRDHVNLPENVDLNIGGDLNLGGSLSVDFRLGIDLGSLEDGITFDEMFIALDDLSVEGTLTAHNLDLALGYGPLKGLIEDADIDLDAGLSFAIDNGGSTIASLTELRDVGFTSLIELTATQSTLDANLPLAVALHDVTAAQTTLAFHTDDLFGDLSDLIAQLPSLDDIANLSIDEIIAGIKTAVDFIENRGAGAPGYGGCHAAAERLSRHGSPGYPRRSGLCG